MTDNGNLHQAGLLNGARKTETEGLNEKDLLCIALHIVEFTGICFNFDDQAEPACTKCQYAISGKCTDTRITDPWPAFTKLGKMAGVNISPFCNERQRKILKERIAKGFDIPLNR